MDVFSPSCRNREAEDKLFIRWNNYFLEQQFDRENFVLLFLIKSWSKWKRGTRIEWNCARPSFFHFSVEKEMRRTWFDITCMLSFLWIICLHDYTRWKRNCCVIKVWRSGLLKKSDQWKGTKEKQDIFCIILTFPA